MTTMIKKPAKDLDLRPGAAIEFSGNQSKDAELLAFERFEEDFQSGTPASNAMLQTSVMIPGGKDTSTLNQSKTFGVMTRWVPGKGLYGKSKDGKFIIPTTNVKIVWIA